jgi:hypothetical protein
VVSSAVEHCLHTAGVTGSIPVPPTRIGRAGNRRPFLLSGDRTPSSFDSSPPLNRVVCHKFATVRLAGHLHGNDSAAAKINAFDVEVTSVQRERPRWLSVQPSSFRDIRARSVRILRTFPLGQQLARYRPDHFRVTLTDELLGAPEQHRDRAARLVRLEPPACFPDPFECRMPIGE